MDIELHFLCVLRSESKTTGEESDYKSHWDLSSPLCMIWVTLLKVLIMSVIQSLYANIIIWYNPFGPQNDIIFVWKILLLQPSDIAIVSLQPEK